MVSALFNLKSQIFSFLDTILTVLDLDPDQYSQSGCISSGAISILKHMDPDSDPDPKHWL